MRVDIKLANFTTKPRFENADFKFHHEQIPKATKKTTRMFQRFEKISRKLSLVRGGGQRVSPPPPTSTPHCLSVVWYLNLPSSTHRLCSYLFLL